MLQCQKEKSTCDLKIWITCLSAGRDVNQVSTNKMQDSWVPFYQQRMEKEIMFRWNCTKRIFFPPLWSQWIKKAFCDHLGKFLLCRHVTNTLDDCPKAATLLLSPSFIICLHLLVFLFCAWKLSWVFCPFVLSAGNGILFQECVPNTTVKQIINQADWLE